MCNRELFQRLSGFETGHPAAAGPVPAFDFRVSDKQDAAFLVSVMDCSDCDSSGLDSPNSSWSIAHLKEYLRGKKRPTKRDYLHRHRHLESLFAFFFLLLFFSLFLFLFSSSLACYTPHFSSTGTQPDKYCFTFSATWICRWSLKSAWMHSACRPTSRVGRSIGGGSFTGEIYFACAATSRVPPPFDREWFHQLANGSQLHAFSQGRAFLCFVVYAHSIGDRRTETCGRQKKKTPMALHLLPGSDQLSLLCHDR